MGRLEMLRRQGGWRCHGNWATGDVTAGQLAMLLAAMGRLAMLLMLSIPDCVKHSTMNTYHQPSLHHVASHGKQKQMFGIWLHKRGLEIDLHID